MAPTLALTLSQYVYDITSRSLYRHVIASKSLLRGLESTNNSYLRKVKALGYVETLRIEDMPAMWHIALLSRASHELRRYSRIFPNVKSVQLSHTVLKGHYHKTEGIMQRIWNIEMMKQRLWKQVPETCEIREIHLPHELEGGDDAQSMTFDIAVSLAFVSEQMITADPCFHSVCIKADDGWSYVSFTLIEGESDKLTDDSGPRNWQVGQTLLDGLHFGLILPT